MYCELLVVDREREDFQQFAPTLEKAFSTVWSAEFSEWIASPERGRFLVVAIPTGSTGKLLVNALGNERDLLDLVRLRIQECESTAPPPQALKVNISTFTSAQVLDSIQRMLVELAPPGVELTLGG